MIDVEDKIHELMEQQLTAGRKVNYLVMSKDMYELFNKQLGSRVQFFGSITDYMGMKVVVLDRDDAYLIVG